MADVVISAEQVRQAVTAARERLQPPPNTFRGGWDRDLQMLQEIDHAVRRALAVATTGGAVALSAKEFELIAPDLELSEPTP